MKVEAHPAFAMELGYRGILGNPRSGERGQTRVLVCPDLIDQLEAGVDIAEIDIALREHEGVFFIRGSDGNLGQGGEILCSIEAAFLDIDGRVAGAELDTAVKDVDHRPCRIGFKAFCKTLVTRLDILDQAFAHKGKTAERGMQHHGVEQEPKILREVGTPAAATPHSSV